MADVPDLVRKKAHAFGATTWLESLDDLIARLERDWRITVGGILGEATEALVSEVRMADGTPAVLKLVMPQSEDVARFEITALELDGGDGCVRLLRSDAGLGALLLERLGPSLSEFSLPIDQRHEILCSAVERVWRPAAGCGLPTGAEKGAWLIEFIVRTWEALDRPCGERAIDHAIGCTERRVRAHDDERARLVHGDVHQWNALQCSDGFKLIDPDGLLAEPEYDLGVLMRGDPVELLGADPHERARWLARRCDLDAEAIWEWGVAERVSSGLLCTQIGLQPTGREMLRTAEAVAER